MVGARGRRTLSEASALPHARKPSALLQLARALLLLCACGGVATASGEDFAAQLRSCVSGVCDINVVDEDPTAAQACSGIGVRSEFGGAGRTTQYGRWLWCLARHGTDPILDLYAGEGDSLVLLADALRFRDTGRRLIVSFEADVAKAARVANRLRRHGVLVRESPLAPGSGAAAVRNDVAEASTAPRGSVAVLLFFGRSDTVVGDSPTTTALSVVCQSIDDFWMALLDPDVEMPPWAFAQDWRSLEVRVPAHVAIYNANLPGGAGWVGTRLLHLGSHNELAAGHNDGGEGETDELLQMRAWTLLKRDSSATRFTTVKQQVESLQMEGAEWSYSTMRTTRAGAVLKVHDSIGHGMIPVEIQRPTNELLSPPLPDKNPHTCLFDRLDGSLDANRLRVPCFISCEGPDFDPAWESFRRGLDANIAQDSPPNESLFFEATMLLRPIINDDELLVIGRSRFLARLRHEFTSDSHLQGFCLYGIASALLVRARGFLHFFPAEFEQRGKIVQSAAVALNDLELAYTLVSDSDSKSGIEFSFLENSPWPIRSEDIMINLELQKTSRGTVFQHLPPRPFIVRNVGPQLLSFDFGKAVVPPLVKLSGVGDHFSATFDAMLMVERALTLVATSSGATSMPRFERALLGRFCPYHAGQRHQCRQRCQLIGQGCNVGEGSGDREDDDDLVAQWLGGVIHPVSLEELPFDLDERRQKLAQLVAIEPRLSGADLLACSHPSLLCIVLADVASVPVFTHASSTLLYGLPCDGCSLRSSTLRLYSGTSVESYFATTRSLLLDASRRFALLAEGSFLATQIERQVKVRVPWVPPLAMYAEHLRWRPDGKRGALMVRSRFFITLMGEALRSLLREIASINGIAEEVTFLGKDNQFDAQWLALEQFADYKAAIVYPNDLHQRTFHELYQIGVPLLVPDPYGLYRAQRVSNWGYASYGTRTDQGKASANPASAVYFGFPAVEHAAVEPWWDSFHAPPFPDGAPLVFQQAADWEQFPHVLRFESVPDLLARLRTLPSAEVSAKMRTYHDSLTASCLKAVAATVLAIL
eukprot:TRINITY_DN73380_c0_g1_i1.p1 TRINITY_DN73380_c0_g1~~TRINITY_DN73380_c0_g1_i1.p1  ORF type:complete len:1080 (-),score=144.82 TRINITY_DN73380_c0_g1_i1:11-3148(-)